MRLVTRAWNWSIDGCSLELLVATYSVISSGVSHRNDIHSTLHDSFMKPNQHCMTFKFQFLFEGLSNDGVELFGNYVDRTSDIQTAVVALMQAFSDPDLLNNSQVRSWIEIYRDLLDSMRLWKERYVVQPDEKII